MTIRIASLVLPLAVLADQRESRVGIAARIDALVLPGSELIAAPVDARRPIVLRITATYPHGSAFRYDLEYSGLDPGEFDLRDYLKRKDGSAADDLPRLPVKIRTLLPPGQVRPHPLAIARLPWFGGYRLLLWLGGVVWVAGLALYWFLRRKRALVERIRARPLTLADRLKPLVEGALQGTLSRAAQAQLELALVAYWRRKLALDDRRPADVIGLLRGHPEAGPLLCSLEAWLHRPERTAQVDLNALLAPYAFLPADALEQAAERSPLGPGEPRRPAEASWNG
ncbi:MAG: hypothetical protein U1E76_09690 [Planctomycetota bacterium]